MVTYHLCAGVIFHTDEERLAISTDLTNLETEVSDGNQCDLKQIQSE